MEIIPEIAAKEGFRPLKVLTIEAEIPKISRRSLTSAKSPPAVEELLNCSKRTLALLSLSSPRRAWSPGSRPQVHPARVWPYRAVGSLFFQSLTGQYTVKLEAARLAGYMAMFFGGICDPITILQLDPLVHTIEDKLKKVLTFKFDIALQPYGRDTQVKGLGLSELPVAAHIPTEVGILGKVLGRTQEQSKTVVNLAKVFFIHAPIRDMLLLWGT